MEGPLGSIKNDINEFVLIFREALCHPTTFCPTVLFKGVTTVLRGRVLRIATSKRCLEIDTRGRRTEGEEPPHGQVTETAGDTGTHYTDSFLTDDSQAIGVNKLPNKCTRVREKLLKITLLGKD